MNEGNPPRSLVYLAAAALVVATGLAMWLLPAGMPRLPPTAATGTTTASPERPTPHPPTHSAQGPSRPPATASAAPGPGSDPLSAQVRPGEPATAADPADGEAAGCPPPSPRASSRPPLARSSPSGPELAAPRSPTPSPPPPVAAMPGCHPATQLRPTRSAAQRHLTDGPGPSG